VGLGKGTWDTTAAQGGVSGERGSAASYLAWRGMASAPLSRGTYRKVAFEPTSRITRPALQRPALHPVSTAHPAAEEVKSHPREIRQLACKRGTFLTRIGPLTSLRPLRVTGAGHRVGSTRLLGPHHHLAVFVLKPNNLISGSSAYRFRWDGVIFHPDPLFPLGKRPSSRLIGTMNPRIVSPASTTIAK